MELDRRTLLKGGLVALLGGAVAVALVTRPSEYQTKANKIAEHILKNYPEDMVDRTGPIISHPTYVSFGDNHYFVGVQEHKTGSRPPVLSITKLTEEPSLKFTHKTFFTAQDSGLDGVVDIGLVRKEVEGRIIDEIYNRLKGTNPELGKILQESYEKSLTSLYNNLSNLVLRHDLYKKAA